MTPKERILCAMREPGAVAEGVDAASLITLGVVLVTGA